MPPRLRSWLVLALAVTLVPLVALTACRKKRMMTREGCAAVTESAHAAMRTLEATYNATRTCVDDADCVEVQRPSCIAVCAGMAVPAKESAIVRQRVAESEERECKFWRANDCPVIAPQTIASCATYRTRCEDTKCTMVYP